LEAGNSSLLLSQTVDELHLPQLEQAALREGITRRSAVFRLRLNSNATVPPMTPDTAMARNFFSVDAKENLSTVVSPTTWRAQYHELIVVYILFFIQ
jgi:hypothetical protein